MYYCTDCGMDFNKPKIIYEKHRLSTPPYEKIRVCPFCGGNEIKEKEFSHCRCCGIKINNPDKKYCSIQCEKNGKKLWELQRKRLKLEKCNPINIILKELNDYNKKNKTNLSYGQYVAFIKYKKGKKK